MLALGLDIGGTRIKAGLVNDSGKIVRQEAVETPIVPAEFRAAVGKLIEALGPEAPGVVGAGVACKGVVDYETTRINVLPGLLRPLEGEYLRDLIPIRGPVYADNDAKVAMVGEMVWGAARGKRDAIMLTLGTGVGGAVVANGRMVRGVAGVAGHLGHVTTMTDGPMCICGNHGCIESLFSADAIESEAFRVVHNGCVSSLTDEFRDRPGEVTCKDVFEHAARGDKAARTIIDRAIRHLGAAIAGLLHVLDPEVVILGGQIVEAGDALLEPLRREVWWRSEGLLQRHVPIVVQQVKDRTGITGGAALVFSELGRREWRATEAE